MVLIGSGEGFNQFDVVSDYSDHHYANSTTSCFSIAVRKKIMKEWRILELNLPDSIYVRVYENRIDLLRAVIVGAAGTPYHDGLFFFDIAFPPDYPTRLPSVHYRSYGLNLNPNLYADGYVCLSLLNTWMGFGSERWDPNRSTVLQVLVSIQALVLNERPYWNEPGRVWWAWDTRSMQYNGEVFACTCRTMLHVLRVAPGNFGLFVRAHFMRRSAAILTALSQYANARGRVGYVGDDGSVSESSGKIEITEKVRVSMQTLYPALVREFREIGAPVGSFGLELEIKVKPAPATATEEGGLIGFVVGKVKEVFGFNRE